MTRPILFAAVLAAMSLPAAAFSQGTETGHPARGQSPQGQSPQGQSPHGQPPQGHVPQAGSQGGAQQGGVQQGGAQGGTQAGPKGAAIAKEDREFVNKAGLGGLFEIRAGQLAAQKAQSGDVKQFGQRMVDDHTAANSRLQKLTQQKSLALPTQLDKKHQDKIDRLAKKTGVDFDKAYADEMIDDHKSDIDDFEKAAKDAKDPDVKDYAATTLPTLREHLQAAQALKDKLKS